MGVKFEHNTEKFTSLLGQAAIKHDKGDFFAKADISKEELILGVCADENLGHFPKKHQVELHYDYSKQKSLLFG